MRAGVLPHDIARARAHLAVKHLAASADDNAGIRVMLASSLQWADLTGL